MKKYKVLFVTMLLSVLIAGVYSYSFLDEVAVYWDAFGQALTFCGVVHILMFFLMKKKQWLYADIFLIISGLILYETYVPPAVYGDGLPQYGNVK